MDLTNFASAYHEPGRNSKTKEKITVLYKETLLTFTRAIYLQSVVSDEFFFIIHHNVIRLDFANIRVSLRVLRRLSSPYFQAIETSPRSILKKCLNDIFILASNSSNSYEYITIKIAERSIMIDKSVKIFIDAIRDGE